MRGAYATANVERNGLSRKLIQHAGPKLATYSTGIAITTRVQNRLDLPASQSSGPRRFVGSLSMPELYPSRGAAGRRARATPPGPLHGLTGTSANTVDAT